MQREGRFLFSALSDFLFSIRFTRLFYQIEESLMRWKVTNRATDALSHISVPTARSVLIGDKPSFRGRERVGWGKPSIRWVRSIPEICTRCGWRRGGPRVDRGWNREIPGFKNALQAGMNPGVEERRRASSVLRAGSRHGSAALLRAPAPHQGRKSPGYFGKRRVESRGARARPSAELARSAALSSWPACSARAWLK